MPSKRWWVIFIALWCAFAESGAAAKAKSKDRTDWDDDAEKELPRLELHGYFRFRGDLFHNYDLGYSDRGYQAGRLTSYFTPYSQRNPNLDIPGLESARAFGTANGGDTLGTASIRFRLEPTINVTEDVRIRAQLDIFDNLVLGSTPDGFPNPGGLSPIVGMSTGQVPPTQGVNSLRDSIRVKRAWGEVNTPFGLLAFGRMPVHWGMGLFLNDGNCLDCDYGDTFDRVTFISKIAGHYIIPGIDFASEGITSDVAEMVNVYRRGSTGGLGNVPVIDRYLGRPFDLDQRDDVNQYFLAIARKDSPKEIRERLENGETVVNYGLYTLFRNQAWTTENRSYSVNQQPFQGRPDTPDLYRQPLFERRGMRAWILDPWFKMMLRKLTLEFEATVILGSIDNVQLSAGSAPEPVDIFQFGAALRVSNKFFHDTLHVAFEAGIASGSNGTGIGVRDPAIVAPRALSGQVPRANNFRFDPDYQLDRILWREIIGAVTNAWYVKPSIQYNVTEGFGVRLGLIYSAAVSPQQWPGNAAPLGFEYNFDIFYKSEEFLYASLGYGGLFPLAGLRDPSAFPTGADPSYAQTIFTRLIIRY